MADLSPVPGPVSQTSPDAITAAEKAAFAAGWNACDKYESHEWGPQPPSTPEDAYQRWKATCRKGHIIRVKDCSACLEMKR